MTADAPLDPRDDRGHYSYAHYASRDVAEGFDALRFGGPIGQYLLQSQEALLVEALSPLDGLRILDVGTGTGRAALAMAARGAAVEGVDASVEMLDVARSRAARAGLRIGFGVADAHALPVGDRQVDAAICFRLLMHVVDWPQCVAELCRVARRRVVLDFPSAASGAALESLVRRGRQAMGQQVEAYRVMRARDVTRVLAAHGFRVALTRRQFVLPIALHKAVNRLPLSLATERALARVGALRLLGSPVTIVAER
jgi:ubiquinone/menaquinone biosynthesis C-methylase UbiE